MLEYEEWGEKRSQVFEIDVVFMKNLMIMDKMSSRERLVN
jgi:hypothetical protein